MAETPLHQDLKVRARVFLRERGYIAHASEVPCPIQRYRADAAGWSDREPDPAATDRSAGPVLRRCDPHTAIIECKVSRADFLRDDSRLPRLLAWRERLHAALHEVRAKFIHEAEPELRRGGAFLFSELESWDYEASRSHAHALIVRKIRRLDRLIHDQTKFFMLAHYGLADRLWLLAPRGLVAPVECPPGWGLLEVLGNGSVRESIPAPVRPARDRHRQRLLRNIAATLARAGLPPGAQPPP